MLLEKLRDPLREATGLPLGLKGAYYVAGEMMCDPDDPTIISFSDPPPRQPGLWCSWEPTGDGESYVWRNGNKNYDYDTWLEYLIEHFFKPWNYKLYGRIECSYHFCKYVSPNGEEDEEDEENEVEIRYVEESELIIKDDNIVIENVLGTFRVEQE